MFYKITLVSYDKTDKCLKKDSDILINSNNIISISKIYDETLNETILHIETSNSGPMFTITGICHKLNDFFA